VPIAAARIRSAAIISSRRSIRSASTPASGTIATCGRLHAIPTPASDAGLFDRSYTCHAIAT
jgi:hypothetical protein